MQSVLILHNTFGDPNDRYYLSRYGVMDQVNAVALALEHLGIEYDVAAVEDLAAVAKLLADREEKVIFNLVEEFVSDNEQACYVPALCKAYGKLCTGNGTSAMVLGRDKAVTKSVLNAYGVRCPQGTIITSGNAGVLASLPAGKYIFKPACCDASEGICNDSILELPAELGRAENLVTGLAARFSQHIVAEQYIEARELNVSLLEVAGVPRVIAIAEIDFSAFSKDMVKIVGYEAKWQQDSFEYNNTNRILPALLSPETITEVEKMALAGWRAIGCSGYARIDFRMDSNDVPYVIEVNPNPDISPDAGFAAALKYAGIEYDSFVSGLVVVKK